MLLGSEKEQYVDSLKRTLTYGKINIKLFQKRLMVLQINLLGNK